MNKIQRDNVLLRSLHCLDCEMQALAQVERTLESDRYVSFVEASHAIVRDGRKLVVTGVGKNSSIAKKISETMASIGIRSMYLDISNAFHGDFGFVENGDMLVYLSRSGKTDEIMKACAYVRMVYEGNVKQAMVHCNPSLVINELDYDVCIGSVKEGDEHGLAPTSSTTAILSLMDAYSCSISSMLGFTKREFYKYHPGGELGKMLSKSVETY